MGVCGCGECLLETARLFKGKVLGTPVPLLLVMVRAASCMTWCVCMYVCGEGGRDQVCEWGEGPG